MNSFADVFMEIIKKSLYVVFKVFLKTVSKKDIAFFISRIILSGLDIVPIRLWNGVGNDCYNCD